MNEQILISAVIPTYNREHTIGRAIDSALGQEYAPAEIIIVDDGSKDNTRKVIDAYGQQVRYVYQPNKGVSGARNRGVREAKSEWVAFLDSDDYWFPGHLQRIVNAMELTENRASLYFSDTRWDMEKSYSYWERCRFSMGGSYELREDATEWALMSIQPMMLQASVIRRSAYFQVGGLPEELVTREDTLLFHKLSLFFPICAVAGSGAAVTGDADRMTRLTARFTGETRTYLECSEVMYKDLLKYSHRMKSPQRNNIKRRLVNTYLSYFRVLLNERRLHTLIEKLFLAALCDPPLFSRAVFDRVRRRFRRRRLRIIEEQK